MIDYLNPHHIYPDTQAAPDLGGRLRRASMDIDGIKVTVTGDPYPGEIEGYVRRGGAMMVNQCVACGAEMPEGDQVCKDCITRSEGKIAWVPVTKRLPEPGERVLATDGYFVGEAYMMQSGRWARLYGMDWEQALCYTVTHWMPMPIGPLLVRKN